jgi:hypothetical protein
MAVNSWIGISGFISLEYQKLKLRKMLSIYPEKVN